MPTTFTAEKQLALGSIIGGLLKTAQREHELSDAEIAQLALTIAAARASEANWAPELFMLRASQTFDVVHGQIGKVPSLPLLDLRAPIARKR